MEIGSTKGSEKDIKAYWIKQYRFGLGSLGAHVGSLKTTHDQEFIHFYSFVKS
jgi:hypothetical protein